MKLESYQIPGGLFVLLSEKLQSHLNAFSPGKKVKLYLQKVMAKLECFLLGETVSEQCSACCCYFCMLLGSTEKKNVFTFTSHGI